jgi:hypothetical protein
MFPLEVNMLAYAFLVLAVAMRFLPHTFHFLPVGAALLFFGARQPRKQMWVPVALLFASDIALTTLVYHAPLMLDTFASALYYAIAILIGGLLKKSQDDEPAFYFGKVAGASLAGSIVFFVISNFAAWLVMTDTYGRSLAGVAACYVAAIPFFEKTFASDMIYSLAIFAAPLAVAAMRQPARAHIQS